MGILSGSRSDRGRREENEDVIAIDDRLGMYLIADGAGDGGKTASVLVRDAIHETLVADSAVIRSNDGSAIQQLLQRAVKRANERVIAKKSELGLRTMASTLALVLYVDNVAYVAHVGDSRAYLLKGNGVRRLTRDHSLGNLRADNPGIAPGQPDKMLVRAIGLQTEPPEADQSKVELSANDLLMLCSDGVSDVLSDAVLGEIMRGALATSPEAAAACLVRAALSHESGDNVSAIILQVGHAAGVDEAALGWLTVQQGEKKGQVFQLSRVTIIGADAGACQITVDDGFTSSIHAEVSAIGQGYAVRDLGSANGTFINEIKISREPLVDGDVLRVGQTPMSFRDSRL